MTGRAIILHPRDNVATALGDLETGSTVDIGAGNDRRSLVLSHDIPFGHKFALADIEAGERIIKYGEVIGRATARIPMGAHAHVQNIESLRGRGDLEGGHDGH